VAARAGIGPAGWSVNLSGRALPGYTLCMSIRSLCLAAALPLAACSASSTPATNTADPAGNVAPPPASAPPEPGTPGGLPDDRGPVSEAPVPDTSAQAAAKVVQTYYALIEAGRFGEARALWPGEPSAGDPAFAASFERYLEYHAQIGAPGEIEGAAGSSYVEVPVVLYGRTRDGASFNRKAKVTLRRVNDVPGSTAGQRRWHIYRVEEEGSLVSR
jgi:hypothetical protein